MISLDMSHNGKMNGKRLIIFNGMENPVKVGGLYKIRKSRNWKTDPFGINEKTKKQCDLSPEQICLVLKISPHWNTPASKLWIRVLIEDTIWDIHSDFLEPLNG